MKNKIERKMDAEFMDIGMKIHTYHIKEYIFPFGGVTVVVGNRICTFIAVKNMVQRAIPTSGVNKATQLKRRLNNMNIYGIAICDVRDRYNKKLGRIIAKGRLLKHLKEIAK